jgi:hypothetical protein
MQPAALQRGGCGAGGGGGGEGGWVRERRRAKDGRRVGLLVTPGGCLIGYMDSRVSDWLHGWTILAVINRCFDCNITWKVPTPVGGRLQRVAVLVGALLQSFEREVAAATATSTTTATKAGAGGASAGVGAGALSGSGGGGSSTTSAPLSDRPTGIAAEAQKLLAPSAALLKRRMATVRSAVAAAAADHATPLRRGAYGTRAYTNVSCAGSNLTCADTSLPHVCSCRVSTLLYFCFAVYNGNCTLL